MPSSTSFIKEIYFAKSLDELQKKADIKKDMESDLRKRPYTGILTLAEKFLDQAKDNKKAGDQEREYFSLYRFLTISDFVKKEEKSLYNLKITKQKFEEILHRFDTLQESLTKRYNDKQSEYEVRKAQLFNSTGTSFPGTSVKVDTDKRTTPTTTTNTTIGTDNEEDNDDDLYPTVTPQDLIEFICSSSSQINKVLIIDIRSASDFENSSISANKIHTKCDLTIINIPSDIISTTYSQVAKKITLGVKFDALERRRAMDRVVIMDHTTHHFEDDSKCVMLAKALHKWDPSPGCIKAKPYLLKGGYVDFVLTYPTYVTQSNTILNNDQHSTLPQPKAMLTKSKGLYDFDEENNTEEEMKEVNSKAATILNGFSTPLSTPIAPHSNPFTLNNISNNNNNRLNSFGQSVPGIAKPIIPDRGSKPKIDSFVHNNLKNDNDVSINEDNSSDSDMSPHESVNHLNKLDLNKNLKIPNRTAKPGHLLSNGYSDFSKSNIKNGYASLDNENGDKRMDISSDEEELVAGDFDDLKQNNTNINGRTQPSLNSIVHQTPIHRRKMGFSLNDMSDDDDELEVEDRTPMITSRSKPIAMSRTNGSSSVFSAPSSLSRSLSSPNIAQLDQESQLFPFNSVGTGGTPKFSQGMPHIDRSVKPLPYQNLLRKHRDFNPQFSSCSRITGLRNLGNTCFMNSVLQCLYNTTELSSHLRQGLMHINPNSKFGSNGELTIELMELFKQMVNGFKHVSPRDLKNSVTKHIPDFVEYKQQDAHEFLVRFLDRVHADMNENANNSVNDPVVKDPNYYDKLPISAAVNSFWKLHLCRNKSIITDLFEGLLVSTVTCLHCSHASKSLEAFTCLSLPIPDGGRTSIGACLKLFLKHERITPEAAWQCSNCKQKRDAEKCTVIWKLPKVLVIHLKRFSYDGMWRQKINTFVDFPIDNLLLEARDGQLNQSYNLYGVVNHSGSLEGGHYISYSRSVEQNIGWHKYDDQDVTPVQASEVITQNAYVLFYKQTKTSSV